MLCHEIRLVSVAIFSALLLNPKLSTAAEPETESIQEEQQAQLLKQKFTSELDNLQKLEQRLNELVDEHQKALNDGDKIRAMQSKYAYVQLKKKYDASLVELQKLQRLYKSVEARNVNREIAAQLSQENEEDTAPAPEVTADKSVRKANPSQSVEALLQEEHALFNKRLTLEAGVTYTHSDRKQLVLNGFLALDAIFLGNIALEGVESDIYRYNLSVRYGLTDRMNINLDVPFVQRTTTYQKGGAGGSAAIVGEADVTRDPALGDVSLGLSYQVVKEGPNNPDIVWNLSVLAPTGEHPYGVPTVEHPTDEEGVVLEVPAELPTGSGVWGATTGFSVVRTLDPAIIFANVAYTYTERESFSDIRIEAGKQPGEVDLGNTWQFGAGIAFAFNERLSMNMSYSQAVTRISKTREEGGKWQNIIGSQANAAILGVGVTYAMTKHLSMVTNVGAGLTDDASDVTFSLKFPYMF